MPEAVIAGGDAFNGGFLEGLVFWRVIGSSAAIWAKAFDVEATAAAVPAAAMNSRRSMECSS
jgi:hypothetical protein